MLITIIVQNYAYYIRKFFFLNYLLLTNSSFHNQNTHFVTKTARYKVEFDAILDYLIMQTQ